MNARKIVADLRLERELIDEAIIVMQRLEGSGKKRGRPLGSKNKPPELRKPVARVGRPKKEAVA